MKRAIRSAFLTVGGLFRDYISLFAFVRAKIFDFVVDLESSVVENFVGVEEGVQIVGQTHWLGSININRRTVGGSVNHLRCCRACRDRCCSRLGVFDQVADFVSVDHQIVERALE